MYADTHIHLTYRSYEGEFPCIGVENGSANISRADRELLIQKFKDSNIGFVVEPGIDLESNEKLICLSQKYPGYVYPVVGIHPTRVVNTKWSDRKKIEELARKGKAVAIGELGLDYHLERKEQHRFRQYMWFIWQILLADKLNLPLVLHIRNADKAAIRILWLFKKRIHGGVVHCFNGNSRNAKIYSREFGFELGIGASVFDSDYVGLADAVLETPIENLVLETDGPFVRPLRPEGISGKQWKKARNTSLIIPLVAEKIAEIKDMDVRDVERITSENAINLFGINV